MKEVQHFWSLFELAPFSTPQRINEYSFQYSSYIYFKQFIFCFIILMGKSIILAWQFIKIGKITSLY